MLFLYHVVSDRVTPYTSQSNIEVLLVQIAPRIAGPVIEVGARDNQRVTKGQLLYRIDPEPFEIAVRVGGSEPGARAAERVSVQTAEVRSIEGTALNKQRTELAVNKELGDIMFGLTKEKALSESDAIRARSEIERATGGRGARRSGARKRAAEARRCLATTIRRCARPARRSTRRGSTSPTPR